MSEVAKLVEGYRRFHRKYFVENDGVYRKLAEGQDPKVAMIACSDSRVDPSILTDAAPGEIFVIRNVANLVPPYQPDDSTYHGTSAALEFAISNLGVQHLIVFGHSQCGGIRALMNEPGSNGDQPSFVHSWMQIVEDVRKEVVEHHAHLSPEAKAHLCGQKSIERSLANLMTFPWVAALCKQGKLKLHGWHFDLATGTIFAFDGTSKWSELE